MKSLSVDDVTKAASVPSTPRFNGRRVADRNWLRIIRFWSNRQRQRRALAGLDDHELKDVGISRFAADREIAKPFWR